MKKVYALLFATIAIISIVSAQPFQKGDKLLGGSLGFNTLAPEGQKNNSTSLNVAPSFGFFTKPNRLTGFSLFYFTPSLSQSDNYGFGASVYRQYWNSLGKNFYFILQGGITGSFQKNLSYNGSPSGGVISIVEKNYTGSVNIAPGFAYRISRRLLTDAFLADFANLYYRHTTDETSVYGSSNTSKSSGNAFGFNSSLNGLNLGNIQIGFRYILK